MESNLQATTLANFKDLLSKTEGAYWEKLDDNTSKDGITQQAWRKLDVEG